MISNRSMEFALQPSNASTICIEWFGCIEKFSTFANLNGYFISMIFILNVHCFMLNALCGNTIIK